MQSSEGAPKKMYLHPLKKKNGGRVQKKLKNKEFDFRRTSTWNERLVICVFARSRTHWCDTMSVNSCCCVKDTTLCHAFAVVRSTTGLRAWTNFISALYLPMGGYCQKIQHGLSFLCWWYLVVSVFQFSRWGWSSLFCLSGWILC